MVPDIVRAHRVRAGLAAALVFLSAACTILAAPAHALHVTTWNLLNYTDGNITPRQANFRTIMRNLDTDLLMVQELKTSTAADSFLIDVLRVASPSHNWQTAGFLSATESTIYYDANRVSVGIPTAINTGGPRQVYQLVVTPAGFASTAARIRMYSVHFKAGSDFVNQPTDSATRRLECTNLRNTLNVQSATANLLMGGDTNFYGDWEGGYQRLTESQANNNGRLKDIASLPGTWNQFAYRCYHSQCPCLTGCLAGFSGGGLDDRFDLFVYSYVMQDGNGVDVTNITPYGNDCNHYNTDINGDGQNSAVPIAVANALHDASDHIPVVITLQLPARIAATSQLDFGTVIVNSALVTRSLSVGNPSGIAPPIDNLDYSLAAPAGVTAPAGPFTAALGLTNTHTITMDTSSPMALTSPLTITSNAIDSLTKSVLLSGSVLAHASASLDSASSIQAASLTFGNHTSGTFSDLQVPVWNRGWGALQARLAVNAATIAGGGGRFSITGGFSPALVSGAPLTIPVHFDDAGATPDQDYAATLTIASADEALPGATPQPDLVVTLHAFPSSGTTGIAEALPTRVAFLPPRPNPFSGTTALRFELPHAAPVTLEIYDLHGRRVRSLVSDARAAGRYEVRWDGRADGGANVDAGLYFARFVTAGLRESRRVVVLP